MKRTLTALTLFLFCGIALATTWAPAKKTDPLTGEKVSAHEIMSYGSYIYSWPSKYDLVFWPLTDEFYICLNPKNGYAAFNSDFEKLADEEKKRLAGWLKENYKPKQQPKTHKEKLLWLERVYGQRKKDDDFWCRFYRLMAFVCKEDEKTSMAYVKKALPLLKKKLKAKPKGTDKLEVLYLLGEYHRRLGKKGKAEVYFSQIKDVKYKDEDGKEQVAHPYFIGLVEERRKLKAKESSTKSDDPDKK